MAPTTRSSRLQDEPAAQPQDNPAEAGDGENDILTLPSGLPYSLDQLDGPTRLRFSNANEELTLPTTCMFVQKCQARDQENFAIIELVESVQHVRTVRFGRGDSRFPVPQCDCQSEQCGHVLWLFDQVAKKVLVADGEPLGLTPHGYARELADPYEQISRFHLDMLAEDLHAQNWSAGAESDDDDVPNPRRVHEVRRMLATLNAVPADTYRPDLFAHPRKRGRVVQKRDLECTIVRMLLANNDFFRYFAASMAGDDDVMNSRFAPLELRAESALAAFDAHQRAGPRPPSSSSSSSSSSPSPLPRRRPKDVPWCAAHLRLVGKQIRSEVQHTDRSLADWERYDVARIMVRLLEAVVGRSAAAAAHLPRPQRSLFLALVGDVDEDFATDVLHKLGAGYCFPYAARLTQVLEDLGRLGAPTTYYQRLEDLVRDAKASRATGSKRRSGESDRQAKRAR